MPIKCYYTYSSVMGYVDGCYMEFASESDYEEYVN